MKHEIGVVDVSVAPERMRGEYGVRYIAYDDVAVVQGACDQSQFRPGVVPYREVSQYSRSMQTLRVTCISLSPLMPKFEEDDKKSQSGN